VTLLGFAVAEFFRVFTEIVKDRPILAHFHEWMAGVAVPGSRTFGCRSARSSPPMPRCWAATSRGKSVFLRAPAVFECGLRGQQVPDPAALSDREGGDARGDGFHHRQRGDRDRIRAGCWAVRPRRFLPNGLNIHRFAAPHEFQYLHQQYKEKINEFVMGISSRATPSTGITRLYLFTSGRYEYRNKGMTFTSRPMARLNQALKQVDKPAAIVAFIITRAR